LKNKNKVRSDANGFRNNYLINGYLEKSDHQNLINYSRESNYESTDYKNDNLNYKNEIVSY